MSIDDLARSAAQDLRATAVGTFDIDRGMARIPVSSRRRTIAQQGTALVVLLVLIVGAFAVRPHLGAAPEPIDRPTPTVPHPTPVPPTTGPLEALMVRGTSLLTIDADGRERTVRDLAPRKVSAADLEFAYVSTAGWLAVEPGGTASKPGIGHEFVNLLDPQAKPVLVRGLFDQRAWSPDGTRLATIKSGVGLVIIDAATGTETTLDLHGALLPGGGPDVIWTADGTGILVNGPRGRQVAPVDGGPLQDTIPDLWEQGHSILANGYVPSLDGTPAYPAHGSFAGWVPTAVVNAIAATR